MHSLPYPPLCRNAFQTFFLWVQKIIGMRCGKEPYRVC